jgi:recombinase, phage RecT family
MAENNNTAVKKSIANFLNFPATQQFLNENLKNNSREFVSNLIAMCENDTNLSVCDPKALMMCAMNATALNLPLNKNLGFAFIIAYSGVPSFQIGYKGITQLAIRTGAYKYLNTSEVREGEITYNKFTGSVTFHEVHPENPVIGYMSYLELLSGFSHAVYMTEQEIEDHALRYSKMYQADKRYHTQKSKWSDPVERPKMAKKTALKALLTGWGVMTTEMARAFDSDDDNERTTTFRESDASTIQQSEPIQAVAEPIKVQI